MMYTESSGPPPEEDCACDADIGRVHFNHRDEVWYECMRDPRTSVTTWAILPPND